MGRFDGKTALITGASSGIGAALAREFVRDGRRWFWRLGERSGWTVSSPPFDRRADAPSR